MTADDTDSNAGTEPTASRTAPAPRTLRDERELGPMRRTIAKRLQESYREAVHVTVSRELDVEAILTATEAAENRFDVDVSVLDVLLGALSETLDEHTEFNATFEDGVHRRYVEHNVGVAVDIDAGLVTPVLGDVASMSVAEIARERRRLTELVQADDHSMSDLRGGTITVTNLGVLNVDSFTPIINPPEVAILGVNRIRERARSTGEGVEFRSTMNVDLTFDHRIVDGADAGRFLESLAGHVENPERLVAEAEM